MTSQLKEPNGRTRTKWALGLSLLVMLVGVAAVMKIRLWNTQPAVGSTGVSSLAVSRTNLVLVGGRLRILGQTNTFSGLMLDYSSAGTLRSRSAVTDGRLHGLSEGWHTNGQLQVTEHFKEGASHGLRTKWHADGSKFSEATIEEGKLHGPFRSWHPNGQLAEDLRMKDGQPDGLAKAYFPSGFMKSRATMRNGSVVEKELWKDGEHRESLAKLTAPQNPKLH
jgi:antitoxin component YwqK of YwqJK toxin-antitoxin module